MARVTVGGDPESYMEAPRIQSGDGDGPSFIASILDMLGIHKQVAKGPKEESQAPAPIQVAPPPDVPVASGVDDLLNMVESISPTSPSRSADRQNAFMPIDPDAIFLKPLSRK